MINLFSLEEKKTRKRKKLVNYKDQNCTQADRILHFDKIKDSGKTRANQIQAVLWTTKLPNKTLLKNKQQQTNYSPLLVPEDNPPD